MMHSRLQRVLIVEDNNDSLEVIMEALKLYRRDVDIQAVDTGEACLTVAAHYVPSLVIVDLALPGIDGWQVLNHLRQDPQTAAIPVVAITSYGSVEVEAEAHRAGFNAYFTKPINVMTFGQDMANLI